MRVYLRSATVWMVYLIAIFVHAISEDVWPDLGANVPSRSEPGPADGIFHLSPGMISFMSPQNAYYARMKI